MFQVTGAHYELALVAEGPDNHSRLDTFQIEDYTGVIFFSRSSHLECISWL